MAKQTKKTKKLKQSFQAGKHFIAMNSMLKCIHLYIEFFNQEDDVTNYTKNLCNKLGKEISEFERKVSNFMPPELKDVWAADWEQRDFSSISRVLDFWVEMSNHDRQTLELICEEIKAGTLKIAEDGK